MTSAAQGKANTTTAGTPDVKDHASDKGSRHSGSSRSSHRSGSRAVAAAAKARAEAEAARTRAQFIQREMAIKLDKIKLEMSHQLEQGKLEANLQIIQHEKEAAATLAQAEILEAAAEDVVSRKSSHAPSQIKMDYVRDYVMEQAHFAVRSEAGTEGSRQGEPLTHSYSAQQSAHHTAQQSVHGELLTHSDPTFQGNTPSQTRLIEQNTTSPHLYDSTHVDHQQNPSINSAPPNQSQLRTQLAIEPHLHSNSAAAHQAQSRQYPPSPNEPRLSSHPAVDHKPLADPTLAHVHAQPLLTIPGQVHASIPIPSLKVKTCLTLLDV